MIDQDKSSRKQGDRPKISLDINKKIREVPDSRQRRYKNIQEVLESRQKRHQKTQEYQIRGEEILEDKYPSIKISLENI